MPNSDPRQQVLKRNPLRDDLALTLDTNGLYAPVKRRAAMVYVDVPAGVLVAGGGVYYPPAGGGMVRMCGIGPDTGGTSTWRFGVITIADIASSGAIGNAVQRPIWPDAPLAGQVEAFQFFNVGDRFANLAQGTIAYPNVPVMPGNIFFWALTVSNLVAEGGIYIEEFLGGNEQL